MFSDKTRRWIWRLITLAAFCYLVVACIENGMARGWW